MICAVNNVRYIEILSIITRNEIWINIYDEVSPGFEHIVLFFKAMDMCTNNLGAAFEGKYIPNYGF